MFHFMEFAQALGIVGLFIIAGFAIYTFYCWYESFVREWQLAATNRKLDAVDSRLSNVDSLTISLDRELVKLHKAIFPLEKNAAESRFAMQKQIDNYKKESTEHLNEISRDMHYLVMRLSVLEGKKKNGTNKVRTR